MWSNRSLNNFCGEITEALYLSSLFGLTQSATKKFCARSDERAIFHLISVCNGSPPRSPTTVCVSIGVRADEKD
ncbi:uncharacterized protein MONOS_12446 [Monocercomonoides exilis]|uniref:uncharacterized protein n=1 Tax=Monocercomonoides exilis TaxID=2049356 RepID=UPI00355A8E47|nr:hypothetical protein MONOS_12446 [Monocercomonoides exilis]|eukprot:MONOS_12446.1-p1 / transcript=MONOS_12446.1 / gene=MONOS_12446 / organism=Monocercomonoides_exilis_PA203 / gene_product=unspecified product / transcript_product=unspecified product / location=Mono_scaffold00690:18401-18991(-) / protein_length=74 / sequence_SO=supercontig / SO=protein_coding / is_pseudo=false